MENKKLPWQKILLAVLIVALLAVIGFVIYLELYKPEEPVPPETGTTGSTLQSTAAAPESSETAAVQTTTGTEAVTPTEGAAETQVPTEAATSRPTQTPTPTQAPTQAPTQSVTPTKPAPTEATEPVYEDVKVKTPYCDLYYSGKWSDQMQVDVEEEEFGCSVMFYGQAAGREIYLFSVLFAVERENSFPIGYYEGSDGITLDISVELSDFMPGEGWSAADADRLSAMQEEINHVINGLSELPGFHAVE